jgi:hypothetical protein
MSLPRRPRHTPAWPFLRPPFASTDSRALRRRVKSAVAAATAVFLAVGVVAVGIAAPASAQENTISSAVTCSPDYTWQVTWSVVNSEGTQPETITASSDTALVPVGTVISAGATATYVKTLTAPAASTLTLTGSWFNGSGIVSFQNSGTVSVSQFTPACAAPAAPAVHSTGLYLYKKLDAAKNAAWDNSGPQTRIATWDGWSYKVAYPVTLPSDVCGPGWGVQQDQITGAQSLFPVNILYPSNGGFAPGVLHDSLHSNLSSLVTVPDCALSGVIVAPVAPTATAITTCGTDGSLVIPTTAGVAYALTSGDGKSGAYVVTATPAAGYRFAGTSQSVTFSGNLGAHTACPVVNTCSYLGSGGVSTDVDHNGWTFTETRANGHNVYVANGLHVYTDGSGDTGDNGSGGTWNTDKAAGYHALSVPLSGIGTPSISLTNAGSSTPDLQLMVDFNNDGIADGTLVGQGGYGTDWWLTDGSAQFAKDGAPLHTGGFGSANHGSLNAWLASFPTARVLGFGYNLGSGVQGDVVIKSITAGCNTYTFDRATVVVTPIPHSNIVAACTPYGASADVYVSNDFTPADFTTGQSFDAQVYVNGVLKDTLTVAPGAIADHHYNFPSSTGVYAVEVRVNGKVIAQKSIDSSCTLVTQADPSAQACTEGQLVDGSITVLLNEHIVYRIDGTVVTTAQTAVAPGTHVVTAELAQPSGIFTLSGQTSWTFAVAAFDGSCGELATHPLVVPQVDSVDRTCSVNGSYTLTSVEGVLYTVDGIVQPAGTYQVSSAKTVHVVASTTSSDFGFDAGQQTVWDLVFTDPANCGTLTTLAFTGVNGGIAGGLLVGMILLMVGAGAITVNRLKARNR